MKWTEQCPKVPADGRYHHLGQGLWLQCQKTGGTPVLPHTNSYYSVVTSPFCTTLSKSCAIQRVHCYSALSFESGWFCFLLLQL